MKKVSIIIPTKYIDDYVKEAINKYNELDYDDFEVLIFPDEIKIEEVEKLNLQYTKDGYLIKGNDKIRIIPFKTNSPSKKRNMSLRYAKGEIFAFIDSDAYPRSDWLNNALEELEKDEVAAVGGPAITPTSDNVFKMASGRIYESFMGTGKYRYRYLPKKKREAIDLPTVNLIMKREVFETIGGFNTSYYPGEDTVLCLNIVEAGYKIIYSPDILVYHHRRPLFINHLKQVSNYAKQRGNFVKCFPKTSLKSEYFIPSIFVLGLLFIACALLFYKKLRTICFSIMFLYIFLSIISLKNCKSLKEYVISLIGLFLTHIVYGVYFIIGLLFKKN